MTSLWTFSDIHQEWPENKWDPQVDAPAHADVLVCAGDVNVPLTASLLWLNQRLRGVRIVYVPGNHDYWCPSDKDGFSYQDQVATARDIASGFGIDLLVDGNVVVVGDSRFVGGTLWTDHAVRPGYMPLAGAIGESRRQMNDCRRVRYCGNRSKDRLEPMDTVMIHRQTRAGIADALAQPFDGPTVVVTHHAPTPASCDPLLFDMSWCYASHMDSLIEEAHPDLWIHGHVHGRVDIQIGETRVLANARGHAWEKYIKDFDPSLVVEVREGIAGDLPRRDPSASSDPTGD